MTANMATAEMTVMIATEDNVVVDLSMWTSSSTLQPSHPNTNVCNATLKQFALVLKPHNYYT